MRRTLVTAVVLGSLLSGCMTEQEKAQKQAYDTRPQIGVTFVPEWLTENDIVVQDVPAGSPAAQAGLMPKDQIRFFNGQKVTTIHELNQLLLASQHGQTVSLGILRNQHPMALTTTLQ